MDGMVLFILSIESTLVISVVFLTVLYCFCFIFFFFSSRRRHTRSVSAFLLNRSSDLIQRNQSAAFSSGKVRPNHETNINIIARRTGKDVNSHTVLDGIITTVMAAIQRINIIGSREGSRNR